ncbi:MAG TPA: acetyl-CoA C-acyltransferase [Thermoleophilaceae bacterium]|nr:acetyl-CoA C-acyltransferase [Thermoleophilaceae bacterium]
MPKTVVLGAARTPFGKLGGALSSLDAPDLGARSVEAALERAGVVPGEVEGMAFGQVLQAGQGQVPSRQVQIKAGVPKEVPSETINKVCASGLRSVGIIDQSVRAGDLEVALAGGMESMSQGALPDARRALRTPHGRREAARLHDPRRPAQPLHRQADGSRGLGGRRRARDDARRHDRYALRSHELATEAIDDGHLPEEIVPVTIEDRKQGEVEVDEGPRYDASLETMSRLEPLSEGGSHTAGNSPGVNDGAGALVLASEEWPQRNGKEILARIVAAAAVADDFASLARTPANAAEAALEKAGLSVEDIDLFEINEAFASVALHSMRMLGVSEDMVNVNGGAIALGHPIGASGARIVGTLIHELRRRGGGLGCAAICSGGGQGDAMIVEVNGG